MLIDGSSICLRYVDASPRPEEALHRCYDAPPHDVEAAVDDIVMRQLVASEVLGV